MLRDLHVAGRTLLKKPGYAAAVIATLGLGIAASAMTFSLLDAALFRALPFDRADRLVALVGVAGPERAPRGASFPEILDWRARTSALDDVVVYDDATVNLRMESAAFRVETELVSARYFDLLGVRAAIGRTFLPEEDAVVDRDAVAVVSHTFWRERLGGDPGIVSRVVHLNERPLQIVGVMPEGFRGLSFDTDLWVPSMLVELVNGRGMSSNRGSRWLISYARLKDGATLEQARDDLARVARELEAEFPATNRERSVDVRPLRDSLLGDGRRLVIALFGAVALLLLVACANVASLQLARAMARRRELAVRIALGAGRWHVARQLLAESVVLSAAAGVFGLLAAVWALSAAVTLMPEGALPEYMRPVVDGRVLLFAFAMSTVVAIGVPLLPALSAWRRDPSGALTAGTRTVEPGLGSIRRPSTQQTLVVAEIALATLLVATAALMARSLERQMNVRLGFDPVGVTAARVSLSAGGSSGDARTSFVGRLREQLSRMPDVAAVAVGSDMPLTGRASASSIVPDSARQSDPRVRYYRHIVGPGYLAALRIPLVRGREFTEADRRGAPLVAIINESGARRFWGADDPIGRALLTNDPANPRIEIVGVAADARFRDLRTDITGARAEPDIFFPFGQRTDNDLELALRTHSGEPVSAAAIQAVVARLDPALPIFQTQPLARAVALQTSAARFASALMGLFSMAALLLAALGLYGLLAYVIGLSRREIAIRLALGADARRVGGLIVTNTLALVLIGALVGVAGALGAGRAMDSLLFQTSPTDPATLVAVALLLFVVTTGATVVPAWRAVHIEPHVALKD